MPDSVGLAPPTAKEHKTIGLGARGDPRSARPPTLGRNPDIGAGSGISLDFPWHRLRIVKKNLPTPIFEILQYGLATSGVGPTSRDGAQKRFNRVARRQLNSQCVVQQRRSSICQAHGGAARQPATSSNTKAASRNELCVPGVLCWRLGECTTRTRGRACLMMLCLFARAPLSPIFRSTFSFARRWPDALRGREAVVSCAQWLFWRARVLVAWLGSGYTFAIAQRKLKNFSAHGDEKKKKWTPLKNHQSFYSLGLVHFN